MTNHAFVTALTVRRWITRREILLRLSLGPSICKYLHEIVLILSLGTIRKVEAHNRIL